MKYLLITIIAVMLGGYLQAQMAPAPAADTIKMARDDKPGLNPGFANGGALNKKHKGSSIWVGSGGIHYESGKPDSERHAIEVQFGMLDLGVNSLQDNTDYNSNAARNFLNVDNGHANADLFSLRQSKSINVNIYPIMVKAQLYKSARQKITLASGVGLQLYNFRFTKAVSYVADGPGFQHGTGIQGVYVALDNVSFAKNKLALNYLTVPLMINAKTKIGNSKKGEWLTYGAGVSGGYLLSSWTKQISDQRGKDKNHDPFNFRKTNLCVNGEIGLDGYIRLYASYQLTSLHEYGLDQHPFSIGVRFLGL